MALDLADADVLKRNVVHLLLRHPQGIKYGDFSGAFYKLHGHHPQLALHGYSSLKNLLTHMNNMVVLEKNSQETVIKLADGSSLNCWLDEGEGWDSYEEEWDSYEEGWLSSEEEMQSLMDEADLSAASVSTTTRPHVFGLSAVKSLPTQDNPGNQCPPKCPIVNSLAPLRKGQINQVADAFVLIREVVGLHPHGLKVKRLKHILKAKHEFDLVAFSVSLGYENTLACLRDIPRLFLQKCKKVNNCVIQLQTEPFSPAPSLDSDVSACNPMPQKTGGKQSAPCSPSPSLDSDFSVGNSTSQKTGGKQSGAALRDLQFAYVFKLLQNVLQRQPCGLKLKKLKEILKAKHRFDLEKFRIIWSYKNILSCLQDIPGLLIHPSGKVNNCVIQLQSELRSPAPSLDTDFSVSNSVPQKMGVNKSGSVSPTPSLDTDFSVCSFNTVAWRLKLKKTVLAAAIVPIIRVLRDHPEGLHLQRLTEELKKCGFDLDRFSQDMGYDGTIYCLLEMPELRLTFLNGNWPYNCVVQLVSSHSSLPVLPLSAGSSLNKPSSSSASETKPASCSSTTSQASASLSCDLDRSASKSENLNQNVLVKNPALAEVFTLVTDLLSYYGSGLKVKRLQEFLLTSKGFDLEKFSIAQGYKDTVEFLEQQMPELNIRYSETRLKCVVKQGRDKRKEQKKCQDCPEGMKIYAFTLIQDVLQRRHCGLKLKKLKGMLKAKHRFDLEIFRITWGYKDILSCLQDIPGLLIHPSGKVNNYVIQLQSGPPILSKVENASAVPADTLPKAVVRPEPAVVHKPSPLKSPVEPQPRSICPLTSEHLRTPDVKENNIGQCPTAPKTVAPLQESVRPKGSLGNHLDSSKPEDAAVNLDFGIPKHFFKYVTKTGLDASAPLQNGLHSSIPFPSTIIPNHPSSKEHHGASSGKDKRSSQPHSDIPAQQSSACQSGGPPAARELGKDKNSSPLCANIPAQPSSACQSGGPSAARELGKDKSWLHPHSDTPPQQSSACQSGGPPPARELGKDKNSSPLCANIPAQPSSACQSGGPSAARELSHLTDAQLLSTSSLTKPPHSEPLDELKQQVAHILAMHPKGMSLFQFRAAYSSIYQHHLPLGNASSAKQRLLEMPDIVYMKGYGVQTLLLPVSPEEPPTKPGPPVFSKVENASAVPADTLPKAVVRPEPAVIHKPSPLKSPLEPQPRSIWPLTSEHLRAPDVKENCFVPKGQCPTAPTMVAPLQESVRPKPSLGGYLDSSKTEEVAVNSWPKAAVTEPVMVSKSSIKPSLSKTAVVPLPQLHPSVPSTSACLRVPGNKESSFLPESPLSKPLVPVEKNGRARAMPGENVLIPGVRPEPAMVHKPDILKTPVGPQPHSIHPLASDHLRAPDIKENCVLPKGQCLTTPKKVAPLQELVRPKANLGGHLDSSKAEDAAVNLGSSLPEAAATKPVVVLKSSIKPSLSKTAAVPAPELHPSVPSTSACLTAPGNKESSFLSESQLPKPLIPVRKNVRAVPRENVLIPQSPVVFHAQPQVARLHGNCTSDGLAYRHPYLVNPSFSVNIPVPSLLEPVLTNIVTALQPVVYPSVPHLPHTLANPSPSSASYRSVPRTPLKKMESVSSPLAQPVSPSKPAQPTSPSRRVEQTECTRTADGLDLLQRASRTQGQGRSPPPVFSADGRPVSSPSVNPPSLQPLKSPSVKQPEMVHHTWLSSMPCSSVPAADDGVTAAPSDGVYSKPVTPTCQKQYEVTHCPRTPSKTPSSWASHQPACSSFRIGAESHTLPSEPLVSMPQPHPIPVNSAMTSSSVQPYTLLPSPPGSPSSKTNQPSYVSFRAGTGYDASRQSEPLPGMSREGSQQDGHRSTLPENQRYHLKEVPTQPCALQNSPPPQSANNCVIL